jgi:hypothetical protein
LEHLWLVGEASDYLLHNIKCHLDVEDAG